MVKANKIRKENRRLRIVLISIIVISIVLISGLLGFMLYSFSRYNLIRISFDEDYLQTENTTIAFLFIGPREDLANGTEEGGDTIFGSLNALATIGDNNFLEDIDHKVLVPIEVEAIRIQIYWFNTSTPSSPVRITSSLFTLVKSQSLVITEVDILDTADPIKFTNTPTNFFSEILTL